MARTSRNPNAVSSVDALDNIDLDDMFADEGDALFDGLDIDLGNMDDITTAGAAVARPPAPTARHPAEDAAAAAEEFPRARRTTKRKARSPSFFDDDDDDEDYSEAQAKRSTKKRLSTGAAPKRGGRGKAAAAASPTAAPSVPTTPTAASLKGKKGKASAASMPPPSQKGAVAAAGQFGGRNKKGSSFAYSLPKTTGPGASKPKISGPLAPSPVSRSSSMDKLANRPPVPTTNAALAQVQATHRGLQQGTFCGLLPSHTLFYPFMPALPNEPALKQRKLYPMVDRIHTSFLTHVQSAADKASSAGRRAVAPSDPIVALMLECYKEDKSTTPDGGGGAVAPPDDPHLERSTAVAAAASETRRTVSVLEKHRLAGDLLAVCALLKRQYDFLRQNKANMEQWCKSHFSEQDYAAVFLPPRQKGMKKGSEMQGAGGILASFTRSQIKVKVVCFNFKEPSQAPLYALVRPGQKSKESDVASPKSKKRKLSAGGASTATIKAPAMVAKGASKAIPSYAEMKPSRRRKCIADLISRAARELEIKYYQRFGDQLQIVDRQQNELQKVVDEDKSQAIHTAGMWRWLEKSGHFVKVTESECRWRLDGLVVPMPAATVSATSSASDSQSLSPSQTAAVNDTYISRLQSLLVSENEAQNHLDENSDDDSMNDLYDDIPETTDAVDLSKLKLQERSVLQLRSFGLLENTIVMPTESSAHYITDSDSAEPQMDSRELDSKSSREAVKLPLATKRSDELNDVINAMIDDLKQVEQLSSSRAKFIESMCQMHQVLEGDTKLRSAETSLISRYQQLVKKNRLEKIKDGKPKVAKLDDLALPW